MNLSNLPEIAYWIALHKIDGIGPVTMRHIHEAFPSMRAAWHASIADIYNAPLDKKTTMLLVQKRRTIDPETEYAALEKHNIHALHWADPFYPSLLHHAYDAPSVIYYKGRLPDATLPLISMVGTRRMTSYGKQVVDLLTPVLVDAGWGIVSGLAIGIDAASHNACLKAEGYTIAVLGNGLDTIQPQRNRAIGEEILAAGGSLISELPPGTPADTFQFPKRNRIIAALSRATLVIEAAARSGALITANLALEYNRDVLAVPGSIFSPTSVGANQLITQGAHAVGSIEELYNVLHITKTKKSTPLPSFDNETEKIIYTLLQHEPLHVDKLSRLARLDIRTVNATLSIMEIKGLVHKQNDQYTI